MLAGVRHLLERLAVPQNVVDLWHVPYPETSSHTLDDWMGDIHGGWRIHNTASGQCTLGFGALRQSNGQAVWVTNSHCTTTQHGYDGGSFYQNGTYIGSEILDPNTYTCGFIPDPCRASDAALISAAVPLQFGSIARTIASSGCEDCYMSLELDHANPTLTISSARTYVIENEILHKIGQTTGWTYGAVEDACADYEIHGWVRSCSDRVDYSSAGGDSGSPVFHLKGNGTIELVGIHFGRISFIYNDALMSNLGRVQMDLGQLSLYDPGSPGVSIDGPTSVTDYETCAWIGTISAGLPPFQVQWSGLFSASYTGTGRTSQVSGQLTSPGTLTMEVWDTKGRYASTSMYISIDPDAQNNCYY